MQSKLPASELQLQSQCYLWAYGTYPEIRKLLWHVPNELKPYPEETVLEHRIRVSKAKAAGLLPGVHDLHLYWRGVLHTFELKFGKNGQSEAQLSFGEAIVSQGGKTYEIRYLEDFQKIINLLLTNFVL